MKVIEIAFVLEKECRRRLKTILPTLELRDKKVVLRPYATIFRESFGISALVNVGRPVQVAASGLIITDDFAAFKTPKLASQSLPRSHFVVIAHRPDISIESIQNRLITNPAKYNSSAYDFYLSGKIGAKVVNSGCNPEWIFDYASIYQESVRESILHGFLQGTTSSYTLPYSRRPGLSITACEESGLGDMAWEALQLREEELHLRSRGITGHPSTTTVDYGMDMAVSPAFTMSDYEGLHTYTLPESCTQSASATERTYEIPREWATLLEDEPARNTSAEYNEEEA